MTDTGLEGRWFLTRDERGNPDTVIDDRISGLAWTTQNMVTPLIHGATYFKRLYDELCTLRPGDWIHFTDWRGDPDERLSGPGTEVAKVLCDLAVMDVHVRGLIWRSHPDQSHFSEQEATEFAKEVNDKGGRVMLDERVRRGGSHHQKLFVVRRMDRADEDVAFIGGIDLCHGRNDDAAHEGDEQAFDMDERYGDRPAWHDIQLEVRGPAVRDLAVTFKERWDDPTPLDHRNPIRRVLTRRSHEPDERGEHPPMPDDPGPAGTHSVQVLRTYPAKRPPYPFARRGERSVARAYQKAYARAKSLIYIEDQYFWSEDVSATLAEALRNAPELRLIAVVPRFPDQDGRMSGPLNRIGQQRAVEQLHEAGGDRVAVYNIENDACLPIYVHAKACIVDDVWAAVGSDNLNRRSWTHDSELSCAILDATLDEREPCDPSGLGDGARRFARDLRLELWREHLGRDDNTGLLDPVEAFSAWKLAAETLDEWHRSGAKGEHPPMRIRKHRPGPVRWWAKWWAEPLYRYSIDPDGRPRDLRKSGTF